MRDLKDEMTTVLKRILLRLADSINGLKISSVEEKVVLSRRLEKLIRLRALQETKDVTLYFNVKVVRDDDRKFGPLIINEIRDSYDEVLDQVQQFTDTTYFGGDISMNWCTSQNGKFELCAKEVPKPSPPAPAPAPTPIENRPPSMTSPTVFINSRGDPPPTDDGGLEGWVIALIIIIVLLLLCCLGYFIFISCRGDGDYNEKGMENNIYMDNNSRGGGSYYGKSRGDSRYEKSRGGSIYDESRGGSRYGESRGGSRYSESRGGRESRSRRSQALAIAQPLAIEEANEDEVQIVLTEPQDPKFDDDSFTINTYSTSKKSKMSKRGSEKSKTSKSKTGRDPTFYVPGQEDKPDPDSTSILMIEGGDDASGRRYYAEDPPLRPKRDPTMYGDQGMRDPTMYTDGHYSSEDPPLKPKRDPTMYVEGQEDPSVYHEGQEDPSMYREGQSDPSMYREGQRDPTMYHQGQQDASTYGDSTFSVNREGYNVDPYGMNGIEEDTSYDNFGMPSDNEAEYMTGDSAEYARGRREPSYYDNQSAGGGGSFRTQEPSMSGKSSKSKKSKKSKSSRSAR